MPERKSIGTHSRTKRHSSLRHARCEACCRLVPMTSRKKRTSTPSKRETTGAQTAQRHADFFAGPPPSSSLRFLVVFLSATASASPSGRPQPFGVSWQPFSELRLHARQPRRAPRRNACMRSMTLALHRHVVFPRAAPIFAAYEVSQRRLYQSG